MTKRRLNTEKAPGIGKWDRTKFYKIQIPKEDIERMYWEDGLSSFKIAKLIGCHPATLYTYMRRNGIKLRPQRQSIPAGEKNHRWNGGVCNADGYIKIRMGPGRHNYKFEHVLVAEKALGRGLRKGEIVHHIDGNRANNENSNLLICTQSYHAWLHRKQEIKKGKHLFGRAA